MQKLLKWYWIYACVTGLVAISFQSKIILLMKENMDAVNHFILSLNNKYFSANYLFFLSKSENRDSQ